ncbi:MAG: hypothetical protein OXH65_00510 [Paracoccaceae bacterium]|nr:hypothetical protein [Paracoccaceae bacterium]MYJ86827.1 hypothetical protein [Paracoccaceae bacterium]
MCNQEIINSLMRKRHSIEEDLGNTPIFPPGGRNISNTLSTNHVENNNLNTRISNFHKEYNGYIRQINSALNLEELRDALNGLVGLATRLENDVRQAFRDFPEGVGLGFLDNALVYIPFFGNRELPYPGDGIFSFEGNRNLIWEQESFSFQII